MKLKSALTFGLPLLTAGALVGAVPAASAAIIGTLEISGANIEAIGLGTSVPSRDTPGAPLVPATTVDFGFIGDSTPADPDIEPGLGEFNITSADGIFSGFNPPPFQAGRVRDLPAEGVFEPVDDFLGFATVVNGTGIPVTDPSTFTAFFDLSNIAGVTYTETANGINVNFDVEGVFTIGGETYDGEGIIGGEVLFSSQPGTPFNDLASFFDYIEVAGNPVNIDSWSGNLNAAEREVPEPMTAIGILTAGMLAASFIKRKQHS